MEAWKYVKWCVNDYYSEFQRRSRNFAMLGRDLALEFRSQLGENTCDDLMMISLIVSEDRSESSSPLPSFSLCDVKTYVRDSNGKARFMQEVSLPHPGRAESKYTVWEMRRTKFHGGIQPVLETRGPSSTLRIFICVFGPVCHVLKDTTKIDNPIVLSIHQNPKVDSFDSLSSDFSNLLETGSFSDIVLNCCGQSFPAHKSILTARSTVFAAMFRNDFSEGRVGVANIRDIDLSTFTPFLQYVYSGKLPNLSKDTAPHFYEVADMYAAEVLKKACSTYMLKNLEAGSAFSILVLADAHSDKEFKAGVISDITRWGVQKNEIWRQFRRDHITLALEVEDSMEKYAELCRP